MDAVDIIGYEGLYKIYPDGKIWGCTHKKFKKIREPCKNNDWYCSIALCKKQITKNFLIHRLLMQHFKPDEWNPDLQVDHINRIRHDNRLDNLRMVTRIKNLQNLGTRKTNTSGHTNISKCEYGYCFAKVENGKRHCRYFKTLEEVLQYKVKYINQLY